MRKDVKIIMAVCAIVLVGLIVYALFVPGEKTGSPIATDNSANTDNNTTADNNGGALAPSTQPAVATNSEATTQPAIAVGPTTAPSETAMAGNNAVGPVAVAGGAAGSSADWNKLLATGQAAPAADSNAAASNTGTGAASSSGNSSSPMMLEATGSPLTNNNTPAANPALTSTAGAQTGSMTGQRTYIVKLGDTPTSIAQAEYGNGQFYTKILAANPKLNARHMHVGQKLIIPNVAASGSGTAGNGRIASPSAGTGSSETSTESAATAAGAHYTVVAGDSLQRISIKLYGSSAEWQKIYDLNKSKIGSSPSHIHVGEVLQLPKAPTVAQSATAAR